jgi:hypothetical protein
MIEARAFLDLAESQIAKPRKARLRAAERRAAAVEERAKLLRTWRAWRRDRVEGLMSGPHGAAARELREFLGRMKIGDGPALVAAIEAGSWRDANADTRFEVLAMIDRAIARLREKSGLPPFDDALPFGDEPATAFQIIREHLR